MRLQSFLSRSGITSRRNVLAELEAGRVKVNGEVVRIPSYPIFPEKDEVLYMDQKVSLSSLKLVYYIFHKPRGVITTAKDTHGRKTALDYFKGVKERLYPVGRLDQETTGLLLLTNDGDLTLRLTHPRYGIEKVYEAILDREVSKADLEPLERGVVLEGETTAPCKMRLLSARNSRSKVEVVLHEGRKRQIRLMFESIGSKVLHLHRKRYGPLNLRGLSIGKSRLLTDVEVDALRRAVGQKEGGTFHGRRSHSGTSQGGVRHGGEKSI